MRDKSSARYHGGGNQHTATKFLQVPNDFWIEVVGVKRYKLHCRRVSVKAHSVAFSDFLSGPIPQGQSLHNSRRVTRFGTGWNLSGNRVYQDLKTSSGLPAVVAITSESDRSGLLTELIRQTCVWQSRVLTAMCTTTVLRGVTQDRL
jgi:hypothetical protein